MFISLTQEKTVHSRKSKLGNIHSYERTKTIAHFKCDNCNSEFSREKGSMDPKRLSNNYFHVCNHCDAKKFAQKRGAERKKIWDLPASSNLPVGKL